MDATNIDRPLHDPKSPNPDWPAERAAREASEGKKQYDLLVSTLDLAEDLARVFIAAHPGGCGCAWCKWGCEPKELVDEVHTVYRLLRMVNGSLGSYVCGFNWVADLKDFESSYARLAEVAADAWDDEDAPMDADPKPRSAVGPDGRPVLNEAAVKAYLFHEEKDTARLVAELERMRASETGGDTSPLVAAVGRLGGIVYPTLPGEGRVSLHLDTAAGSKCLSSDRLEPTAGLAEQSEAVRVLVAELFPSATRATLTYSNPTEDDGRIFAQYPVRLDAPADTPVVVGVRS